MPSIDLRRIKGYALREKAVLLLPLLAVWCGLTLSTEWRPSWDSAMYIAMGESIAGGEGVRYMGYGGIKYPPGFPLMLGMIHIPFGRSFLLMRLFVVGCAVGSAWLAYLIVRDRSDRRLATAVMCASVFSYAVLFECTRILADLPYMFLSLLALRWVERFARQTQGWRGRIGYVAIALVLAAYFTRVVGLTLFAGTVAYLALGGVDARPSRANLKKAIAVLIVLITIPTIWAVQNQLRGPKLPEELREALSYEKELLSQGTNTPDQPAIGWRELAFRVRNNMSYYEGLTASVLLGRPVESAGLVHGAALILAAGYLFCVIRQRGPCEYYVLVYLLVCMMWTSRQGERFLVPVVPLLLFYALRPLWLVLSAASKRSLLKTVATVALVGISFQLNWARNIETIRREHRRPYHDQRVARILEFAGWLETNTPPDTIVVSDQPAYVYLFSGRKTFSFPWHHDADRVRDAIREMDADYVISMPTVRSRRHLYPMLARYGAQFEIVHRRDKFAILRVKDDGSGG